MAADSETPELPQQVSLQALSCFLVHVDYVIIKTEIRVYNCTRLLKATHSFYELLISWYWYEWYYAVVLTGVHCRFDWSMPSSRKETKWWMCVGLWWHVRFSFPVDSTSKCNHELALRAVIHTCFVCNVRMGRYWREPFHAVAIPCARAGGCHGMVPPQDRKES